MSNRRFVIAYARRCWQLLAVSFVFFTPALSAEPIRVATTFTVIADMARQVAGEHAEVVSITRPGAEIHNYQPTPHDIIAVQQVDLVLWNGLNLERWFERFFTHLEGVPQAVVSEGIEPLGIGSGPYAGKPNPHAWMSFEAAERYVANIREALIAVDPEHASAYRANAARYQAAIRALGEQTRASLASLPEAQRWLVTSEGAFSYLARDLGLKELYLWPINADANGTPQQVRRVVDTLRRSPVPAIFSESTVSAKPAKQVARETGVPYGGVLYVDSLSLPDGPVPSYLELMRVTTTTVKNALLQGRSQ